MKTDIQKKLFALVMLLNFCILTSCEKTEIEEEIFNLEENEIIAVDREEIERPGDQDNN